MDDRPSGTPAPDDTAAFQRFYAEEPKEADQPPGILYRVFVGWWRRDRS
jgi:hypothetical protein